VTWMLIERICSAFSRAPPSRQRRLPLVLPMLESRDLGRTYKVNQALSEDVGSGGPELVHSTAVVGHSLPRSPRARAVVFTAHYGAPGAINETGTQCGRHSLSQALVAAIRPSRRIWTAQLVSPPGKAVGPHGNKGCHSR
jgi:hypothetical protein